MKFALGLAAGMLALAGSPAGAQVDPTVQDRIRQIVVYGTDPCPPSVGDEIIVCARRPETERYRIPEEVREREPEPGDESWAARARSFEYIGETGIQSCSTVGPGGHTGCLEQLIRQAREERRAAEREASRLP